MEVIIANPDRGNAAEACRRPLQIDFRPLRGRSRTQVPSYSVEIRHSLAA